MGLTAGVRLGVYEIIAPVGAGGMGEVYRATDTKLRRDVAIKVLPEIFSADPERIARFQREAELLATLNHPNIAQIYGLERQDGPDGREWHAIVLELIGGETLAERVARGPIEINDAIAIARQLVEALEAAHDRGVIHRDLKPANIKITPDGKVKVLDFGLAKMAEREAAVSGLSMSPTLSVQATYAGMILGTAAYMSPEQARGKPVDRKTDVWAFGCVVYEMLAGRQAFEGGETVSDAVAAILRSDIDWSALPASTPPHLLKLLRRCLQKDPQKRLPHIGSARLDLDEPDVEPAGAAAPASPAARPRRRTVVLTTAGVAVLAAVAGAAVAAWLRPAARPTVARFVISLPADQRLTGVARTVVALSPDGSHIVYVANGRLYSRSLREFDAKPIAGTEGLQALWNPVFSPDGGSLAFYAVDDSTVKRIPLAGGAAVTICHAESMPNGMSWVGDDLFMSYLGQGIMRVSANGGTPELVAATKPGEFAQGPQLLPDRRTLLFAVATGQATDRWDKAVIVAQQIGSSDRKAILNGGAEPHFIAATGQLVYALGGSLFAVAFDPARLTTSGAPVPVMQGVRRSIGTAGSGVALIAISDSGTLAFIPGPASAGSAQMAMGWFDRNGVAELLKGAAGAYERPRLSPDGRHIAVGSVDARESSIWILDVAGGAAPRRLTFEGQNRMPIWSSDGQYVVYQSDREGDVAIYRQRADGTGPPERLTRAEPGTLHIPEAWTTNPERLFFASQTGRQTTLNVLLVADRKVEPFSHVGGPNETLPGAVISPDRRWIAYASRAGRTSGAVYVEPLPPTGAKYQVSNDSDDGHHPVWSPDGTELFFTPGPGERLNAVRVTTHPTFSFVDEGALRRPFQNAAGSAERPFDVGRDGRFLGLADGLAAEGQRQTTELIDIVLNWFDELKQRVPGQP